MYWLPFLLQVSALATLEVLVLVLALIIIVFVVGRAFLHIIYQLVANSVLGLISIILINYFFGVAIVLYWWTWILVALFGLPAVLVLVILKLVLGWAV